MKLTISRTLRSGLALALLSLLALPAASTDPAEPSAGTTASGAGYVVTVTFDENLTANTGDGDLTQWVLTGDALDTSFLSQNPYNVVVTGNNTVTLYFYTPVFDGETPTLAYGDDEDPLLDDDSEQVGDFSNFSITNTSDFMVPNIYVDLHRESDCGTRAEGAYCVEDGEVTSVTNLVDGAVYGKDGAGGYDDSAERVFDGLYDPVTGTDGDYPLFDGCSLGGHPCMEGDGDTRELIGFNQPYTTLTDIQYTFYGIVDPVVADDNSIWFALNDMSPGDSYLAIGQTGYSTGRFKSSKFDDGASGQEVKTSTTLATGPQLFKARSCTGTWCTLSVNGIDEGNGSQNVGTATNSNKITFLTFGGGNFRSEARIGAILFYYDGCVAGGGDADQAVLDWAEEVWGLTY